MIQPNDVNKVENEDWEAFKKKAMADELYYNGPGDRLDDAPGRSKFCRLNESGMFRKPDPLYPGYFIYVFNNITSHSFTIMHIIISIYLLFPIL